MTNKYITDDDGKVVVATITATQFVYRPEVEVKIYKELLAGTEGAPGAGVPVGGTAGQILSKIDGTDYNTEWQSGSATYETLDAAGDVGSSAGQLAIGNHAHAGIYEPADATILKDADIGSNVQAYDANIVSDASYVHTDNNLTNLLKAAYDSAYAHSQAAHAPASADNTAANETSHADVVVDGDFVSNGLLKRTSAGVYGIQADNSANWDIAYGWGDHAGIYSLAAHTHAGVYEPADATILKDADIGVNVQAYNANIVIDASYVHTDNNFTSILKTGYDSAYSHSQAAHAPTDADNTAANETSHADVVVDGDFATNGIMTRTGAGIYAISADNTSNWDTAYGWGDHAGLYSLAAHVHEGTTIDATAVVDGYVLTADGAGNSAWEAVPAAATYEVLDAAGDVGTGVGQLAIGNHTHAGVYEPADATILKDADIGSTVEAYDATILKDADIGSTVEAYDATILKDADIGSSVAAQAHVHEGTTIDATAVTDGHVLTADGAGNSSWEAPTGGGGGGPGGPSALEVVDESTSLTTGATKLTFAGAGVTATEPVADEILITIPSGGGSALEVEDDGVSLSTAATKINFEGFDVTEPVADEITVAFPNGSETEQYFRVHKNGVDQTPTYDDWTKMTWSHEEYSQNMGFDFTNNELVIPATGLWHLGATITYNGLIDSEYCGLRFIFTIGGVEVIDDVFFDRVASTVDRRRQAAVERELSAGDTVDVTIWHGGASADTVDGDQYMTFFYGHRVSAPVIIAPNGVEHSFSVNKTSEGTDQTFPDTNFNKVTWSGSNYSQNASFDFTNNEYVIPSDGRWEFLAAGQTEGTESSGVAFALAIYVDGALEKTGIKNRPTGAAPIGTGVAATLDLVAGQVVSIYCQVSNTAVDLAYVATSTWFEGKKTSGSSTGIEHDSYDVAFSAKNAAQGANLSAATWTKVVLDVTEFDKGANFDTVNSRFIAPVNGVYQFASGVRVGGLTAGDDTYFTIYKNGAEYAYLDTNTHNGTVNQASGAIFIDLFAGDYIELWVYTTRANAYILADNVLFSGALNKSSNKAECSFRAYLSTDITDFPADTETLIELDTVSYNYGDCFDIATNIFTAPEDGRYLLHGYVRAVAGASEGIVPSFYVNSTRTSTGGYDSAGDAGNKGEYVVDQLDLLKNDEVEFRAYHNGTAPETIRGSSDGAITYFTGYRMISSQDISKETKDLIDVMDTPAVTNDVLVMGADGVYEPHQLYESDPYSAFSVQMSALKDLTTGSTLYKAPFDTIVYDNNLDFDTTNNWFVAPEDGLYLFNGFGSFSSLSTGDNIEIQLWINEVSAGYLFYDWYSASGAGIAGSKQVQLSIGDTVEMRAKSNRAGADLSTNSYFTGSILKATPVLAPHGVDHYFSVHKDGSDQNITTTAITPVTWAAAYSLGTQNVAFDFTNNQFVAPVSGLYYLHATVQLSSNSAATIVHITTTGQMGSRHADRENSTSGYQSYSASGLYHLNAGETAKVELTSSDANYNVRGNLGLSYFGGMLVSGSHSGIEYDSYDVAFDVNSSVSTDQILTTASVKEKVALALNSVPILDTGNNWDGTNKRFIVPVSGVYQFNVYALVNTVVTGKRATFYLYVDGVEVGLIADDRCNGASHAASGSRNFWVDEGQIVELWWMSDYGTASIVSQWDNAISFSGHLIKATTKAESSFHVTTTTAQSVPNSTGQVISFENTQHNIGNNYNNVTDEYVAPEAGRYWFKAAVMFPLNNERVDGDILVDGVVVVKNIGNTSSAGYGSATVEGSIDLAKDAVVTVEFHQYSGSSANIYSTSADKYNYFMGRRETTSLEVATPTPSGNVKAASFSVDDADGFDHWYSVSAASVVATIPTGLANWHRFTVYANGTTTFVTTGLTINLPAGKQLLPNGDGAAIGFIHIGSEEYDVIGDLANV